MKKDVNYHIWNDEPIQADYYTNIDLPNGGSVYTSIGKVNIEKGDIVSVDYGSSYLQATRSGKGPQSQFPYGKIHLHGVPANVVLSESKSTNFVKSSEDDFSILVKKQTDRISNILPALKEQFILQYMDKIEQNKKKSLENKQKSTQRIQTVLTQMDSFFKPKL